MQRRTRPFSISPIAIAVAIAIAIATSVSCAGGAHAAELGEVRVASHIGQQLVADIELTMLEDGHAPVQARLADPEVYSGAGIALPPALSTLSLSVMRRDGRQFLHATTLRPVDADHLHLYVELVEHGQRSVRLATLWLTPDPNPLALPLPSPAAVPAAAPTPLYAPASAPARARGGAGAVPQASPAPHPQPAPAPAPASPPVPMPASIRPMHPPPPLPLPLPLPRAPATCAAQDGDPQSCATLGVRNAELRSRIGQLEERVKGLQARLGVAPGAPHDAVKPVAPDHAHPALPPLVQPEAKPEPKPEPKPAPPPGPKPISSIKPLVAHKPKTPPPDDDLPPGAIGAGVALLVVAGAAAALLKARAKRKRNIDIDIPAVPSTPGLLDKLRRRFGKRGDARPAASRAAPVGEAVAEPSLE